MDRAQFLDLIIAEWKPVHRFALRLARDSHLAEDITQDVYTQALRPERIAAFEPRGGGLRSWLLRITYRTYMAHAEKHRTRGERQDAWGEAAEVEAPAATDAGAFDWEHVDERVRGAVEQLDDGSRAVLLLWAVDRLQYKEIAEVLGIPIGTVMSRLHRARTRASASLLADPRGIDHLDLPVASPEEALEAPRRGEP